MHIKETISYDFMDLEKLNEEMKLRGFSKETIKTYTYHIQDFLNYCGEYSGNKKRDYLLYLTNTKDPNSVRLASSAIDFYIRTILKQEPEQVPLPKRKKKLPTVLEKEQIKEMILKTNNIKHQLIIEILYSSGIRLSELINLTVEDIDPENHLVTIRQGKGAKDRVTIISKKTAQKIKEFAKQGRIFKGRKGNYSKKSVQAVLEQARKKAGIPHKVTPHMLRHSFATHLLESGTNLRYIQSLLGHEKLETTQIYTKVAKTMIKEIKSPLD